MTHDERIALFTRDLAALMNENDAMVIFNLAHDEDTFAQFSHARAGEPLLCEVSNRSEGWNHIVSTRNRLPRCVRSATRFLRRTIRRPRIKSTAAMWTRWRQRSSRFL